VQLRRRLPIEVHLTRTEVGQRHVPSVRTGDRREAVHPIRIGREEDHAWLAPPLRRRLDGDLIHDRSRKPIDQIRPCDRRADTIDSGLTDPAGARSSAERAGNVIGRASGGHCLVCVAERVDRGRTHGVVHRVAGGERRSDDGRAEHEADDDECAAPGASRRRTKGELQQNAVAERQDAERACRDGEADCQDDEERVDWDAEELVHR
jgi:hypothetical protein